MNPGAEVPDHPVIETKRLILRLLEKGDLPALFAVNGDDEVFRYSPRENWKTPADGEAWLARVIVLRDGGRPIGTLAVFHFEESVGSAEIGYCSGASIGGKAS